MSLDLQAVAGGLAGDEREQLAAVDELQRQLDDHHFGAIGQRTLQRYPIGEDGYAVAFDPVTEPDAFLQAWVLYGVVVGRQVVDAPRRRAAVDLVHRTVKELSQGRCDLDDPTTWSALPADARGEPILTRGFFEVYHDHALADLRQAPRLFLHHALIWRTARLWTTYDRLGVKLPGHPTSAALPAHVDQNPVQHPGFRTVQGILALEDCPLERGVTALAPGSSTLFGEYLRCEGRRGFVELDDRHPHADDLREALQPIPLRAGDIVSWDSRTTHTNTDNVSDTTRYVALVAAGLANPTREDLRQTRRVAWASGIGDNDREALMHASSRPRYENPRALAAVRQADRLTALGRLLYGVAAER